MRYKQPDSSVPVLIQQIVRPLGMYDDTLDPLGVYFFETSLQIGIVIYVLRNRFMNVDYAFLGKGDDIHKRQINGVPISQINETGLSVTQDKTQQHQIVPQQTTYFTEFTPFVLVQEKRLISVFICIIRQNGNIQSWNCRQNPAKCIVVIMHSAMHPDVIDKVYFHGIFL